MEVAKIGDPWSILPIKNALYAKECTQVDLSGRNLESLQNFENFPNLEAIFLNNNQLVNINALQTNFRLKRIFCSDNRLADIDVVKNFKFIEILLLSNNQLKDLDHILSVLSKLTFLEQLNLDGNPVAEEPKYRLKIILQMPKLKILDRHAITVEEKIKAQKLDKAKVGALKKAPTGEPKKKIRVSEAFSQGEKDLYREVKQIEKKREEARKKKEEEEKKAAMPKEYEGMPETQLITTLRKKANQSFADKLTDAEYFDVEELLQKEDPKGSGTITVEGLKAFIQKLKKDEGDMGKIPRLDTEEDIDQFISSVKVETEEEENKSIPLGNIMKKINSIKWKFVEPEELKKRVAQYYEEANKMKMLHKTEEALLFATKALHLDGVRDRSKGIEPEAPKVEKEKSRKDVASFRVPSQKYDEEKIIKTIVNKKEVIAKTKYDFAMHTQSLGQPRQFHIN